MDDFVVPKEMRVKYLERRRQDLSDGAGAIEKGDFMVITRIGHNLKGNAASFGFDELSTIGEQLETAGRNSDKVLSQNLLVAIGQFLDRIGDLEDEV